MKDARGEDLKIVRTDRIWSEDAISRKPRKRMVLGPPYARGPALPCDVQCLTLLCISYEQTGTSVTKKSTVRVVGVGSVVPGGFQSKRKA